MSLHSDAYRIGERLLGEREIAGGEHNPLIVWMLQRVAPWAHADEVPWCAAFADAVLYLSGCDDTPRSARARSWLAWGNCQPDLASAGLGDVVIFARGADAPGPHELNAPGHVGLLDRVGGSELWVLGGNQSDGVTVAPYPVSRLLGIRRLV